jgi:proteic killer suppression protein
VIVSFCDAATEDIFNGSNTKAARSLPKELWKIAARKLSALDYATDLRDLSSPGNNLEKLKGALSGKYSLPTHRAPTPPGEILLEEWLKPMKLTQLALAQKQAWDRRLHSASIDRVACDDVRQLAS